MRKTYLQTLSVAFVMAALALGPGSRAENGMLYERWMTGGSPDTLLTETSEPDYKEIVPTSEWGVGDDNALENFRARLTGWLVPPVTGTYYFWICTDDGGRIWLSEDETPDKAVLICRESGWRAENSWAAIGEEEVSGPIRLEMGKLYWIRGGLQEIGGGDHIQIAWRCDAAGIPTPTIIENRYLLAELPPFATNPNPPMGAVDVPLDAVLSWDAAADPNGIPLEGLTGHHVFFGTDPENLVYRGLQPVEDTDYDPAADGVTLEPDRVYYWRIDESFGDSGIGDPNTVVGLVWSFKSLRTIPDILKQPADMASVKGVDVIFAMDVYNPETGDDSGLSYAWKKVGEEGVISTESRLILPSVTSADEGAYYCTVSNATGSRDSETAMLDIIQEVVLWTFSEGAGTVASDSSGNGIDGTVAGSVIWVPDGGRAGDGAIHIPGIDGATVLATNVDLSGKPVNDVFVGTSSWTINMWIKPTTTPGNSMLGGFGRCDFVQDGPQDERYLNTWGVNLEFQPGGNDGFWPGGNLGQGAWKMLTVTYDGVSKTCVMYIDAQQIGTRSYNALADVLEKSFKVGPAGRIAWADPTVPIDALFDEFCVYDGAVSAKDVQYLYSGSTCNAIPVMDFDGDCVVGLSDLLILLQNWMENNMVE